MKHLDAIFRSGTSWGAIESILFHATLTIHNIALFRILPLELYGTVGALFSVCYLMVTIATMGLDSTLGATLGSTHTKERVNNVLKQQLLYTITLLSICALIAIGLYQSFIIRHIYLTLVLTGIIFAETVKKSAKALLTVACAFRVTALADLGLITSYITMVWGTYACGIPLTITHLFVPLLLSACGSALYSCIRVYQWYKQLPATINATPISSAGRARFHSFFTQFAHLAYSGNILVPLVASTMGLAHAGILKLISSCIHSAIIVIERTFGITSTVLFAHTTNRRYAFSLATQYLIPLTVGGACFMVIFLHKVLSQSTLLYAFPFAVAYVGIYVCSALSLTYERLLLSETRGDVIGLAHAVSMLISFCTWILLGMGYMHILTCIALARLLYLIIVASVSYILWRIHPPIHLHVGHVALSTVFFAFMYFII